MSRLILQAGAGVLGLWLADQFVSGVSFQGPWQTIIFAGVILGLINFFLKPALKLITLPLRILTFGLFAIIINMVMVWLVDILFPELIIQGIIPLFWTTIIVWLASLFLGLYKPKKKPLLQENQ